MLEKKRLAVSTTMLARHADLKTIADERAGGRADALAHMLDVLGWS
jgi:hypothetical protein